MLLRIRFVFVLFVIVISRCVLAATPDSAGLYLSFSQRLLLTYAFLAQGEEATHKEQLLRRVQSYFLNSYKQKTQTVNVRNFDEFLEKFRGEWPNTQSVALDVAMIEKAGPQAQQIYVSDSPRVQGQIDRYIERQERELMKLIDLEKIQTNFKIQQITNKAAALVGAQTVMKGVDALILNESEALLSHSMKELDRVGEKIAESSFAKNQDTTMRIFMQTMLSEYFSRLSPDSKKLIISSFLGGDLQASDIKKFEIMVQNSGPQLQKLLQIVARQADLDPEVLKVFRALENSVRAVPWSQVEDILKKEKSNFKFTYFERKPLGVGTMAQVHRAKIEVNGQRHDVVVRFIKPGIAERVAEDKMILTEVARILDENPEFRKTGAPKLSPIVNDITATVTAELSQEDTIARQILAKTRYEKSVLMKTPEYKNYIEFQVPKIYKSAGKSNFMVQEMVLGQKLDKEAALYQEVVPGLKKAVIEEMAKLWAYEVLFDGGFYHSDLHQGNFMMRVTEPKIIVSILDYGMGGVISREMQRKVMLLGAGTELKNAKLIARAYWDLSDKSKNTLNETQFHSLVEERVKQISNANPELNSLERWTAWAMDAGVKLPYEFISLNRGIVIVNKLLADAGSSMTLTSMMKTFARQNPMMVYKNLILEEKVSHNELLKLGWQQVKDKFQGTVPPMGPIRCETVFN